MRAWPLSGELRLQTQSLGFIDSYVALVDRVSGQLDANLSHRRHAGRTHFQR